MLAELLVTVLDFAASLYECIFVCRNRKEKPDYPVPVGVLRAYEEL